jgi:hypothetical protein
MLNDPIRKLIEDNQALIDADTEAVIRINADAVEQTRKINTEASEQISAINTAAQIRNIAYQLQLNIERQKEEAAILERTQQRTDPSPVDDISPETLASSMLVGELRAIAKTIGVTQQGKEVDLAKRILATGWRPR